ncbi:MAG: T9SS C-terminal target domain-containing protein [Saprospirales bacterium]|nr:MAG: T9SS C-terminal target domain-containing protein [Saprospirales bacterium]
MLKFTIRNFLYALGPVLLTILSPLVLFNQELYFDIETETDVEYHPLEDGELLSSPGWTNANFFVPLDFALDFMGTINSGPIENSSPVVGVEFFRPDFDAEAINIFTPYHTSLTDIWNFDADYESKIRYSVTGEEGERVLTIEYYRAGFANMDGSSGVQVNTTFQVSFFEINGEISLHFGPQENREFFHHLHDRDGLGPLIYFVQNMRIEDHDLVVDISGLLSGDPDDPYLEPFFTKEPTEDLTGLTGDPRPGTLYRFVPKSTSTVQIEQSTSVSVWPTIASDYVYVSMEDQPLPEMDYTVIGIDGREFSSGKINGQMNRISILDLPAGSYIVRLESGGKIFVRQIVKVGR